MFRAEDLVERPAAIERFIMELLADPEPPPVSRPEVVCVLFFLFRYMYDISRMLAGFLWALGSSFNRESLCWYVKGFIQG
jgi:hypothetical protein